MIPLMNYSPELIVDIVFIMLECIFCALGNKESNVIVRRAIVYNKLILSRKLVSALRSKWLRVGVKCTTVTIAFIIQSVIGGFHLIMTIRVEVESFMW
jgi:hypothetical protein